MDRLAAMATLLRVVDTGSFSAAARQLNVGQPAVSKTIAQLEEWLGVRLLLRSTRGLTPTDAGLRYCAHARRALEASEEAEHAARGAGAGLSGVLRVAAATTFARLLIVPRLPAFLAAHPALDIDLVLDDRVIDLVEEGIDLSIRLGALPDSAAIARRLATGRRSIVATPAYLERAGEPACPADLQDHQAIVYAQGQRGHWRFQEGAREIAVAVQGRVRVSSAEGLRAAVLADLGVAMASNWMFAPELASGAVRQILASWALEPVDLWAIFPTGRLASTKARAFADFVAEALRPDSA